MKFLADMGVSMSTVLFLREKKHDVVRLREQGLEKLDDALILDKARKEKRIILTFDLDFGDLLATGIESSPSVIIFRLHNQTPKTVNAKLSPLLDQRTADLQKGSIVIIEDINYRIRHLPILA